MVKKKKVLTSTNQGGPENAPSFVNKSPDKKQR